MGNFPGHGFNIHTDLEVLVTPLGLCRPETVSRHLHLPH